MPKIFAYIYINKSIENLQLGIKFLYLGNSYLHKIIYKYI